MVKELSNKDQPLTHLCLWCKNKEACDFFKIYQVVVYECVCNELEIG